MSGKQPAFPCPVGQGTIFSGMDLRDYFAARALQMIVINDVSNRPENFMEHYSAKAYAWADAMLKAREATP